ncbi:MAG: MFS transporter [Bacteroidota bacterium]
MPPTLSAPAPSTRLFPVLLVNFIGMMGYSIVMPLLIFLVQDFGGNAFIYGLLGAMYPALQMIGAPLMGKWSDQIGRKRVLMISQSGTFLAWCLFILSLLLPKTTLVEINNDFTGPFLLSLPLIILFLARAFDGLTGGNVSVANAYLSDISTDENRKANFGKMASSTSLGFVLGPMLASLLGGTALKELLPVMAAATVSLLAIMVIRFRLPESRPELVDPNIKPLRLAKLFQIEHKECYEMEHCDESNFRSILREPGIPLMFLIYFLTFLSFSFFYAGLPIFASTVLEWETSQLGLLFTYSSGLMILVQGPLLTFLSDKVKGEYLVLTGALLIMINFIMLPMVDGAMIYVAISFMAIGNGMMWPSFLALLAQRGSPKVQGSIQGYANSMGSLASIFGLVLGGTLFGQIGPKVFWIAAVVMCLVFLVSLNLLRTSSSADPR